MTTSSSLPPADDIDLRSLGAALWRAKGRIIALSLLAGAATFIALSMMRPLYTSEARILVQNEETAFTRPTAEQGIANYRTVLDEQAVQSQVQVLNSRDLILKVVRDLDLTQNADFARDASGNPVERLLRTTGLLGSSQESQEERAANALAENLEVYQLSNSSVIAIEYTSGDPQLAAQIANTLATVYINWQRDAKIEQTKDATAWLDAQIKALRNATAESEEAVEAFKASEGLYAGSNNVTLNAQQLSELNSQLILAEAQESEAQARAKLIKKMLAARGDIDATPEVLNSQLVISLIEQRVLVQRQLAELSATLLPSHPRIQQLRSELSDVRAQIRAEAQKVVGSLENQAQIAAARESSLRASLNAAKTRTAGQSDAEVKLRALEREAKANRDLLESYLARYRDASARHDIGAVPAQAAIVSRAHASVLPSFPRRVPMTLLVTAAMFLLAIGTVLAKAIIVSDAPQRSRAPSESRLPDERVLSEPEYMSRAEMLALSRMGSAETRPPQPTAAGPDDKPVIQRQPQSGTRPYSEEPPKSEGRPKRKLRKRPVAGRPNPRQNSEAPAKPSPMEVVAKPEKKSETSKPTDAVASAMSAKQSPKRNEVPAALASNKPALPAVTAAPVQKAEPDVPPKPVDTKKPASPTPPKTDNATSPSSGKKSVWRAAKPAKRPSWLAVSEPRSKTLGSPKSEDPKPQDPKPQDPKSENPKPQDPKSENPKLENPKPVAKQASPMGAETPRLESAARPNAVAEPSVENKPYVESKAAVETKPALETRPGVEPKPATETKSADRHEPALEQAPVAASLSSDTAKSAGERTTVAQEPEKDSRSDKAGVVAAMTAPVIATAATTALSEPKSKNEHEDEAAKEVSTPDAAPDAVPDSVPQVEQARKDTSTSPAGEDAHQPVSSSSMDLIQRIRQDVLKKGEAERAAAEPKSRTAGFLDRLRGKKAKYPKADKSPKTVLQDEAKSAEASDAIDSSQVQGNEMAALNPNDLRHYLTQRIAVSDGQDVEEPASEPGTDVEELGPVIGSLEEIVDTVLESSTGGLPRTMLVAGLSPSAQSPEAAIGIARDLAGRNEQVALVDLAKGAAVVSGLLNMQRIPGFSDLAAGAVDFSDVVKLDDETALQVIPGGNPMLHDSDDAPDNFMKIFEALTQTYDCVVLHADMVAIERLMPALKFELPVAVAVLPPKAKPVDERESLSTVQRLGCPVVLYGTPGAAKQRRFSLFGRKVAV